MTELTKLYPMVQIKKNTWEIDEFDCASIFLLIGTEKAMVIDCPSQCCAAVRRL